jgi:ligand-binding sensor domain-containing protein/serine phosphatase RsbU (regulator of sigma subunit)
MKNSGFKFYALNLLFCFLFLGTTFKSQTYNFIKFSTKNGLANSNVKCAVQSRDGYLWFGTQGGGVSRFNGKEFKTYSVSNGLLSNDVTSLAEDKSGNLWIGTTEGLCMFDGNSFKSFAEPSMVGKTTIYNVFVDNEGAIWIPTDDKGLKIYRNNSFVTLDTSSGLKKNRVFAVCQENENSFWVSTHKGGVYKVDKNGKVLEIIDTIAGYPNASVFCMLKNPLNSDFYFGSNNSGLFKFSAGKFTHEDIPEINNTFIGTLMIDKNQNLWIGSDEAGLVKYSSKIYTHFTENEGLSSISVNSIVEDYEGNLWIGTQLGGLNLLKSEAIINYSVKDGLPDNKILASCNTAEGSLYVSTKSGGIYFLGKSGSNFERVVTSPEQFEKHFTYLITSGNLLLGGTENNGMVFFNANGKTLTPIKNVPDVLSSGNREGIFNIIKILKAADGNFWVASYGSGLFLFTPQGELLKHYSANDGFGLNSNDLLTAGFDAKGRLIVSEHSFGLKVLEGGRFLPYSINSSRKVSVVWSIAATPGGRVYFGTQDEGLLIQDGKGFTALNKENGLCSNYIQTILLQGNEIWLGTDKGVNHVLFGNKNEISEIRFYGVDEGLMSEEITQNGVAKDLLGNLWFCTQDGLACYSPKKDFKNSTPPKLLLSDIKLFYENVNWADFSQEVDSKTNLPMRLELPYDKNNLTFIFRALTTDKVNYKFILENLDADWSPYTVNDQAVYTNIPPGNYVFRVVAKNSFGIESKEMIAFTVKILPPFWKTWWFYVVTGLLLCGALFSFFRWRTAALEKENRLLEQKVDVRTNELKLANQNLSIALHDIKDSINYAERIQRAMLPVQEIIHQYLPHSFVFLRPRDVVSGDFYWFNHKEGVDFLVAADCTGHGVPGAFMSMVGSSLLNEIVLTKGVKDPSVVLSQLNTGVQYALRQRENNTRDGMDMAFCAIDYAKKTVHYSGANRSLWIIRNQQGESVLEEIKPTKCAIGGFTNEDQHFVSHTIQLNAGDSIYLHSDGFADQFGGPDGKKLMTKRFKEILISIQEVPMKIQGNFLSDSIDKWMATGYEQVDDMLVIGVKF